MTIFSLTFVPQISLNRDVFARFFFICRRLLLSLEGEDENESEERTTRVVVLFVLLFVDENIFECTWQRFRRGEEDDDKNQTRRTKDVYDCDEYECE